jgi:hypothetical protein
VNAPSTATPAATANDGPYDPPHKSSRRPKRNGLRMPAMFDAKFWMPPIEATCWN